MHSSNLLDLPLHPTMRHPLTGEPLRALYVTSKGRPMWPLMGGAPGGDEGGGDGGSGAGSGGGDGDGGKSGGEYTPPASQADLDRIVGARLARERERYADYEDLKKKAEAHDAALEAAKTEQEKAVDAARKEGESTASERANARIVAAEVKVAAAQSNAHNPAAVVRMLDLTGIKVGDDGEVDAAAVKAKLDALKTSDPYLFGDSKKPGPKKDPSQGGGDGGGGGKTRLTDLSGSDLYDQLHPKKS